MTTTVARAWHVLAEVMDPEIPVLSVLELGIVRDVVETGADSVEVSVTPTYSGCPATEVIVADIRTALSAAYREVEVRVQLSPPWTTDWISDTGRAKLRGYGIAPPNGRALLPLVADDQPAACPQCGSRDIEQLAGFGSTPCKALWRCRSCREPFDYFKVH
ncbi:MAG TPA: 1,2-phenylacetyl-CoA epoxidase subunit PaaD [Mycobacteriales bacterium]|nr:1,2-phenylacetyl-CoA epoxidase subunit PaaD [Mycobacteriales bacterium]